MARPKKNELVDLKRPHELTAGLIERLTCPADKDQVFLRDSKAPGLRVRVTSKGFKAFVFEAKLNGKTIRRTIGDVRAWSIDGPEGTRNARSEANRLRVTVDSGEDPRELERQAKEAAQSKDRARLEAEKHTLKHLLTHYCNFLETQGRVAHKDARSVFKLHVLEAWPGVSALPAAEVTGEQVADMMRSLLGADKRRTANKLRSYMRAAYQMGKEAKSNANVPLAFKAFNVLHNPAAETTPDAMANKSAKNPLLLPDMRTYWKSIKGLAGFRGAVLRLHLLTGAQRLEQLVRLKTSGIEDGAILLFDGKGRPGTPPREHLVPLIPPALEALKACGSTGEYALSTDKGNTPIAAETLSEWAAIAGSEITDFQTKRLRSGVETLLAKLNIPKDDRGRLQSHGIAGVQARHYDAHDYLDVKLRALVVLFNTLDAPDAPEASNVVQLHAAAG